MTRVGSQSGAGNSQRSRLGAIRRFAHLLTPEAADKDEAVSLMTWATLNRRAVEEAATRLVSEYKPATVRRTWTTVRQFCAWAHKEQFLTDDPTEDVIINVRATGSAAIGDLEHKHFSDVEIQQIRTVLEEACAKTNRSSIVAGKDWPRRDRAVIEMLRGCGLRASELIGLTCASVESRPDSPAMVRIRAGAKGDKPRDVPIPDYTREVLAAYMHERADVASETSDLLPHPQSPLFVRLRLDGDDVAVEALSYPWLYYRVERILRSAGVHRMGTGAVVHAFRHTAALGMAARNVPTFLMQQVLGHADPKTTSGYVEFAGTQSASVLRESGWLTERPDEPDRTTDS